MIAAKKGFTLIELLIVIGILAILATVTVVVLNPGQLLAQARDSSRISDLAAINSSIALYLSDVSNPAWAATAAANCTSGTQFPGLGITTCTANAATAVNVTTSWVNINFTLVSTGSPLAKLPLDPINLSTSAACAGALPTNGCFYAYKSSSTVGQYEIDANMESTKYSSGTANVENNDGGNVTDWYEVGSKLDLIF